MHFRASHNSACEGCSIYAAAAQAGDSAHAGKSQYSVALAGNPNTGKSTLFNTLTGLRQHTGNWSGKTVARKQGSYSFHDKKYVITDLPGTYSLVSSGTDEEIARNHMLFDNPDVTIIVTDATRLERNLNLVLQILAITRKVVVCVNMIDEARRKGILINQGRLSAELNVPVVFTAARDKEGLHDLLTAVEEVACWPAIKDPGALAHMPAHLAKPIAEISRNIEAAYPGLGCSSWLAIRLLDRDPAVEYAFKTGSIRSIAEKSVRAAEDAAQPDGTLPTDHPNMHLLARANSIADTIADTFHDALTHYHFERARSIAQKAVAIKGKSEGFNLDRFLDNIFISPIWGYPVMFVLFALMFWITIAGANYPSAMLFGLLVEKGHPLLNAMAEGAGIPAWIRGLTIDGMYLATAWVISVMLPPMAIFFPLFTLLEDLGYLPRVAFNMDGLFKKAGAHGKQVMTMMMGFGCNAAGVVATRIIDSPRERLIAIITNNFAICNGRWPTQILIATIFIGALVPAHLAGIVSAMAVVGVALFGIVLTFIVSWGLSKTVLKGKPSVFSLELPPYRLPKVFQTLYTSLIDRTMFVLWRAIVFALPAGAVIWLISNIHIADATIAEHAIALLDPVGWWIGLNGVILVAYIVAIPANEIVIPTVLMLIVLITGMDKYGAGAGVLFEADNVASVESLLRSGGWTMLTAVNLMIFSLVHNPCSTTIFTIYRETKSVRWTAVSTLLPIVMGIILTGAIAFVWRLLQ